MKAKELDKKFENDEDITKYLDMSKARRPAQEQKRVNVDFPIWMINPKFSVFPPRILFLLRKCI